MNKLFFYSFRDETEVSTFDLQSSAIIKLNNNTVLYLKEVNRYLALVCILRTDSFEKQGWLQKNKQLKHQKIRLDLL